MSTENTSEAMAFLEGVTGGPLTLGDLLLSIRLGEGVSQSGLRPYAEDFAVPSLRPREKP